MLQGPTTAGEESRAHLRHGGGQADRGPNDDLTPRTRGAPVRGQEPREVLSALRAIREAATKDRLRPKRPKAIRNDASDRDSAPGAVATPAVETEKDTQEEGIRRNAPDVTVKMQLPAKQKLKVMAKATPRTQRKRVTAKAEGRAMPTGPRQRAGGRPPAPHGSGNASKDMEVSQNNPAAPARTWRSLRTTLQRRRHLGGPSEQPQQRCSTRVLRTHCSKRRSAGERTVPERRRRGRAHHLYPPNLAAQ